MTSPGARDDGAAETREKTYDARAKRRKLLGVRRREPSRAVRDRPSAPASWSTRGRRRPLALTARNHFENCDLGRERVPIRPPRWTRSQIRRRAIERFAVECGVENFFGVDLCRPRRLCRSSCSRDRTSTAARPPRRPRSRTRSRKKIFRNSWPRAQGRASAFARPRRRRRRKIAANTWGFSPTTQGRARGDARDRRRENFGERKLTVPRKPAEREMTTPRAQADCTVEACGARDDGAGSES